MNIRKYFFLVISMLLFSQSASANNCGPVNHGSLPNNPYYYCEGEVVTRYNYCGQVTGTLTGLKDNPLMCNSTWSPNLDTVQVCANTRVYQSATLAGTTKTRATYSRNEGWSWGPNRSSVCSGTNFTQTSNCGFTRTRTGTKYCTDNDNDGVLDNVDSCLGTPNGESVNSSGCSLSQLDTDNDGVSDDLDICPSTPSSETPNAQGCSPSQLDEDQDGIIDLLDQCPATPNNETVDSAGCSVAQVGGVQLCTAVSNVALTGTASQSSDYHTTYYLAGNANNDDTGDFSVTSPSDANPSWSVDLSSSTAIEQVILHNIPLSGYYKDWLKNITLTIEDSSGTSIYTSALLNPDNWLDGPDSMTVNLPKDTIGSKVTVSRTSDGGTPFLTLGEVNVMGCTDYDLDFDGVFNAQDSCEGTQTGATVDALGCSVEQLAEDEDNDGVSDYFDACPGTPPGAPVYTDGCTDVQIDSDGDGTPDYIDAYPYQSTTQCSA